MRYSIDGRPLGPRCMFATSFAYDERMRGVAIAGCLLAIGCGRYRFEPGGDADGDAQPMADARAEVVGTTPVSDSSAMASCPAVVADATGWAVAWRDGRDGNGEIYFARLDAQGAQLGGEIVVGSDPTDAGCPSLVWTGSRYAIAFSDARFGDTEILLSFRDGQGAEIGQLVRVTNDGGESATPSIGFDGSGYDVAWTNTNGVNDSTHYLHLDANGAVVGNELTLSGGAPFVRMPVVLETPIGAAISWYDSSSGDSVRLAVVQNGTPRFNISLGMAVTGTSSSGAPAVAWVGSQLLVLFSNGDTTFPATYQLFASTIDMAGMASPPRLLDMAAKSNPAMVTWPSGLAVVSLPGLRFATYDTTGTPLDAPFNVATSAGEPALAFANGTFGVVYVKSGLVQLTRIVP